MTQTDQGKALQGQPGQPQPGTINPASAQGGQGESQPSMTQVDTTRTAGATATQMDRQGRSLGVEGRLDAHDQPPGRSSGAREEHEPDTKPSESQP